MPSLLLNSNINSSRFCRAKFTLLTSLEESGDSVRCLPDLINFNAIHNPQHVFCIQARQGPSSEDTPYDLIKITFLELAQAVERICEWILSNIPEAHAAKLSGDGSIIKCKPIAIFMESDIGLFMHLAALLTLNIPCLLLSTRLRPHAVLNLLSETEATSLLVSPKMLPNAQHALSKPGNRSISLIKTFNFDTYLSSSPNWNLGLYHQCSKLVREDDRNVLILHSSGTTGLPKAIRLAHRNLLGYAACHSFPIDEDESTKGINLSTLPLYHGFGALAPCLSLSVGKAVCLPPSTTIPSGSLVISLLQTVKCNSLMTVPTIMEDITSLENYRNIVGEITLLDFVAVGGGGLKPSVAELLHSDGVKILNHFGATELGALAPIFRPTKYYDYRYLRLRTDLGLELKMLKEEGGAENACKLIGYPFAWDSAFELQDILECNPLNPSSEVRIIGRHDDIIVLASGEKVLPHLLERSLEQNPLIRRAIVFGNGQFEIGALIEPTSDLNSSTTTFIDSIWPTVLAANEMMDSHAKISTKHALLVKDPQKSIPLSDKGVPQRNEVYSVFETEITAVYESLKGQLSDDPNLSLDFTDLLRSLRQIVQSCLPEHCQEATWNDEDDFIHLGMDSLQATKLRRLLEASLKNSTKFLKGLPLDFIYSHPTLIQLSGALINGPLESYAFNSAERMLALTSKYTTFGDLGLLKSAKYTVLLTGATGNLGANVLELLALDDRVTSIICLGRKNIQSALEDSQTSLANRQLESFANHGITMAPEAWAKISFLTWNPGADRLGLSEQSYQMLADSITHVFHCAWPMDFNKKLQSFEHQIKATKDIVELGRIAHQSRPYIRPRIMFASSIAVSARYLRAAKAAVVPETILDDPSTPMPMGYAEAKWVCEKILQHALTYLNQEISAVIVRIGQLSGSRTTGYWSPQEHFAALLKASQSVGAMPALSGTLSWLPVDLAAQTVLDILLHHDERSLVFHLENPIRQPWGDVCTVMERKLGLPSHLRLPYALWLSKVMNKADSPESLKHFFEEFFLRLSGGGLVLSTQEARRASKTLRQSGAVPIELLEKYVDFWKGIGFLKQ